MLPSASVERRWLGQVIETDDGLPFSLSWRHVQENVNYPYYFVCDRLRRPDADSADSVARDQGKIVHHQGKKAAAYRDAAAH